MLYLEDYLEMIEHLPQELRDRFTEMRELDLAVQNHMDSLDRKSRLFFQQCKRGELQVESMDAEFNGLRSEYFKVMEDADEKVAIATQIHELVERYLRRLDTELFKFKCELEADNNGITEILEKRSLELDGNSSTSATALLLSINQKENRYYNSSAVGNMNIMNSSAGIISSSERGSNIANSLSGSNSVAVTAPGPHQRHRKLEKRRETICTVPVPEKRPNLNQTQAMTAVSAGAANHLNSVPGNHVNSLATHMTLPVIPTGGNTVPAAAVRPLATSLTTHGVLATGPNNTAAAAVAAAAAAPANGVGVSPGPGNGMVSYNLQQLGGGAAASSAIAAAASQAIVATQQMPQGRRTASLKASYEAIHGGSMSAGTEFWSSAATGQQQTGGSLGAAGSSTSSSSTSTHLHQHHHQHQQQVHPQQQQPHHGSHHPQHQQQEKKHKKKLNSSVSLPTGVPPIGGGGSVGGGTGHSSSANSITSSSPAMSIDSVDMLTNASTTVGGMQHTNLGHASLAVSPSNQLASGQASSVVTASGAAPVTSISNVNTVASAGMALPSTAIVPGSGLTLGENGLVVEQTTEGEWSYDPNEPRYCTCNQVSYGDMVACDNDACPYEWFHYQCVGITQPPKGKWYCPKCTASMRRRGNRKN